MQIEEFWYCIFYNHGCNLTDTLASFYCPYRLTPLSAPVHFVYHQLPIPSASLPYSCSVPLALFLRNSVPSLTMSPRLQAMP